MEKQQKFSRMSDQHNNLGQRQGNTKPSTFQNIMFWTMVLMLSIILAWELSFVADFFGYVFLVIFGFIYSRFWLVSVSKRLWVTVCQILQCGREGLQDKDSHPFKVSYRVYMWGLAGFFALITTDLLYPQLEIIVVGCREEWDEEQCQCYEDYGDACEMFLHLYYRESARRAADAAIFGVPIDSIPDTQPDEQKEGL